MTDSQRLTELLSVAAPGFTMTDVVMLTPTEQLGQLVQLRTELDQRITRLVVSERRSGTPWSTIGQALGVGGTAAQKRYRSVAPVVRRRTPSADA